MVLRIASWNIENFGLDKVHEDNTIFGSPVKEYIASNIIAMQADIVIVMELIVGGNERDPEETMEAVLNVLNNSSAGTWWYNFTNSDGTGGGAPDRYGAFYKAPIEWNASEIIGSIIPFLNRAPGQIRFQIAENNFIDIFVLHGPEWSLTISIEEQTVRRCVQAIAKLAQCAEINRNPLEYPSVIVGDFNVNAGFAPNAYDPLTTLNFQKQFDAVRTTLKAPGIVYNPNDHLANTYDNILVKGLTSIDRGIHDFAAATWNALPENLKDGNTFLGDMKKISDHIPVWVDVEIP